MPPAETLEVVLHYDDMRCQVAFPVKPDWQKDWYRPQTVWPSQQQAA